MSQYNINIVCSIDSVTDDHHFKDDSNIHYQFVIDKIVCKKLLDALVMLDCSGLTKAAAGLPLINRKVLSSTKVKSVPPLAIPNHSNPVPFSGRHVYSKYSLIVYF